MTTGTKSWQRVVAPYQVPDTRRSVWQIVTTIVPFVGLWYLAYLSLSVSYWLTLLLTIPIAALNVRIFVIMHDCGHGSFFRNRRANEAVGYLFGVLCFTPFFFWRHDHAIHHATSGDLHRRGSGDVTTLTVREYLNLSRAGRLKYRLYRAPIFLFVIGPVLKFVIEHRIPRPGVKKRERNSVHYTNLGIAVWLLVMWQTVGLGAFVAIHLPMFTLGTSAGVWLFYVQHQFEDAYWRNHEEWDYSSAAMLGSSFYRLPRILQWVTLSIGYHHVHHLSPLIPNYHLERCHDENEIFASAPQVTLRSSLKSLRLRLWDEEEGKLIGFGDLARYRATVG